ATFTLTVTCPTITINPATLPAATLSVAYSQQLTGSGSAGAYTFSVSNGTLPTGLQLSSAGLLSGTPTVTGAFNFTITADSNNCRGSVTYSVNVTCPTVTVNPATLPGGLIGTAYTQTITTTPVGGYSFVITSGALPMGLMLDAGSGVISGTPTGNGTFNFTIMATGACSAGRAYTVTIGCASITVNSASLPNAAAGIAYNQSIPVTPAGNYTFSLIQGSLPSGLTLNSATGVVSGLPSVVGTYNFVIKAQSANDCYTTQSYALQINCPTVSLSPTTLPPGSMAAAYNQNISAAPAGGGYRFNVTDGALPTGLILNPSTGALTGTPMQNGVFNFTVTAMGFGSCAGSKAYSITVGSGTCSTITLAELPSGQPGQLYNQSVAASPAGSYSYAVTSGSLPPGLTLFGSFGLLYGFPTTAGTFNFTITASGLGDAGNCTGAKSYSLVIGGTAVRSFVFGDFDGDGKTDLSVWRGASGEWLTVNSGDSKAQSTVWGSSAAPYLDVMTPGDYDGDGRMDLAVFRRGIQTGQGDEWFIKSSRDGAVTTKLWGLGTDIPVPGDYDGDGKTDIAVWRGSDTNWYIIRSSDGQIQTVSWGTSKTPYNDVPVAADFDGDGRTDVAVFRRANGHWYIKLSSDGSVIDKAWGLGTDVPVAADYDGDGKADVAVWRGADTNWYIVQSSDGAVKAMSLGNAVLNDVPVPGDYDGDGKADVAVWRASSGEWLIKGSRDGSVVTKTHGLPGDTPVTNKP
ncbi:MAG TPA: putative Ig domain-containing protein, partial [Blastocatellia bacterium]|nr:putative Ig domain-containing protein [Blastocatellia bacterium]HNG34193.1 putative Ig domain-containing protein [Blastocatellia bacterium]